MEASRVCLLVMKYACQKSPNSCLPLNSFEYTIKKFRKIFYYFFFKNFKIWGTRCAVNHTTRIAEIGDSVYSRRSTRYASPPMCPTTLVVPRVKAGEGPWRRIHVKCWEEQDHACFKPCIKLALILTIGWSCSPFLIEPRLSHFKVHPIPIQLWVGPPFRSSVISTGAFQWDLSDYVTTCPRKTDEMILHCTKLTLDHQPMYILDPLPSNQDLNGWDVFP